SAVPGGGVATDGAPGAGAESLSMGGVFARAVLCRSKLEVDVTVLEVGYLGEMNGTSARRREVRSRARAVFAIRCERSDQPAGPGLEIAGIRSPVVRSVLQDHVISVRTRAAHPGRARCQARSWRRPAPARTCSWKES